MEKTILAKNLKLKIKNSQLAKAAGLDKLKAKLARKTDFSKKEGVVKDSSILEKTENKPKINAKLKILSTTINSANLTSSSLEETPIVMQRRIRAKPRSSFAAEEKEIAPLSSLEEVSFEEKDVSDVHNQEESLNEENNQPKDILTTTQEKNEAAFETTLPEEVTVQDKVSSQESIQHQKINPSSSQHVSSSTFSKEKFGPTGKHINHLLNKSNINNKEQRTYKKEYTHNKYENTNYKHDHYRSHNNEKTGSLNNYHNTRNSSLSNYRYGNTQEKTGESNNYHNTHSSSPSHYRSGNTQEKTNKISSHFKNKMHSPYSPKLSSKEPYSDFNSNKPKGFSQSIVIQPKSSSFPKKEVKKTPSSSDFKDHKTGAKKFSEQKKVLNEKNWYGLSDNENEKWRKKRQNKIKDFTQQQIVQRPNQIKVRLPITIKDLASELKLKASELIKKMFIHGMTYVVNDILDDETIVQFIGAEFSCNIAIDNSEKERIQIVSSSIKEEILETDPSLLVSRPPVVAFMGHVDHGKTSLIDAIRKSNRVFGEAGAITQHIGAFRCSTSVGTLTILDTPGHEAFSAMRARGAEVCDIIVLVLAGDEGIKEQTLEAIEHAKNANITILVAINKSDKPNFNAENIFRQLADVNLLPEAWGGTTITVNTSAKTGEGISELLEMLALQSEVLELKANPSCRARGLVIESQRHKGLGAVATVLVQNGTLHFGDAVVFNDTYGHIKTMTNEHGEISQDASPSTPVAITGLSDLPLAGDPFIVVKSDKEAKEIVSARIAEQQYSDLQKKKKLSFDKMLQNKKILRLVIRADVQGSIEALATSIMKINSNKIDVEIVSSGIGEITESDINLAAAAKATIIGFHTSLQNHAETLVKNLNVQIKLCNVIYHAIDEIKVLMKNLLDPVFEEKHLGSAEVKAIFKSSQLGIICGCLVVDGVITRSSLIKLKRDQEVIWKGHISSLKRIKEDVREVKKGLECGILLDGYNQAQVGDILETFEIISKPQEL